MKKLATFLSHALVGLALAFPMTGMVVSTACTPQEAKNAARDALSIAQIACIVGSEFFESDAVMEACRIQRELRPAVEPLLQQKRAAKRAGACAADAGAEKDASDQ